MKGIWICVLTKIFFFFYPLTKKLIEKYDLIVCLEQIIWLLFFVQMLFDVCIKEAYFWQRDTDSLDKSSCVFIREAAPRGVWLCDVCSEKVNMFVIQGCIYADQTRVMGHGEC